jgi:hypothetical protein
VCQGRKATAASTRENLKRRQNWLKGWFEGFEFTNKAVRKKTVATVLPLFSTTWFAVHQSLNLVATGG